MRLKYITVIAVLMTTILICSRKSHGADNTVVVSSSNFKVGLIKLVLPRGKPRFDNMVIKCDFGTGRCFWTCEHGFNFSPVLKDDQQIDEAVSCVDEIRWSAPILDVPFWRSGNIPLNNLLDNAIINPTPR